MDIYNAEKVLQGSKIKVGSQDVFYEDAGAYTGEVSASMLNSMGVNYVIIGHSERRSVFNESNENLNLKITKAYI